MDWRRLRSLHARRSGVYSGLLEIFLLGALWFSYTFSRLLASNDLGSAVHRAKELVRFEKYVGLDWERPINEFFVRHDAVGLFGAYWYSAAHYIVTLVVLVWLYLRHRSHYVTLRRALLVATILALGLYLMLPTAPPRFVDGFTDVLNLHSTQGWWGADASAPRGLGGLTNELAAFPSLHAGWALWVALAVQLYATRKWVRVLGWGYAVGTAIVIIGTGNHWVIDALMGWVVVIIGWIAATAIGHIPLPVPWRRRPSGEPASRAGVPVVE